MVKTVCEPIANKRNPANSYDAQFSIPYIVATGLRRGHFTLDELEDEALGDADSLDLAVRASTTPIDPASTFPRHYTGEVIVETRGGRTLRHREAVNRGNGERPLSEDDIIEKFRSTRRTRRRARKAQRGRERSCCFRSIKRPRRRSPTSLRGA